jgi:hypothetical protein
VAYGNLLKLTFFKSVLKLDKLLESYAVAGKLFHGSITRSAKAKLACINSTILTEQLEEMATRVISRVDI